MTFYRIRRTAKFKRQYRKLSKSGDYDMNLLDDAVAALAAGERLAPKYRDHPLTGDYAEYRECHITPDWLLIYRIDAGILVLVLHRTGSHSDLF